VPRPSRRPRVVANFAVTFDGKITTRSNQATGFTSDADKQRFQEIRAMGDAVVVGRGTLEADNMGMGISRDDLRRQRTARGQEEFPVRVVVSQKGTFDPDAKFFRAEGGPRLLFSGAPISAELGQRLADVAEVVVHEGGVEIPRMLRTLREHHGVKTLVCEGGPTLFRSFLEADALDELYVTLAPRIFGGQGAPTLTGLPGSFLHRRRTARLLSCEEKGSECFLHYQIVR